MHPKDHAYVSKEVFEQSLKSMIGNSTDDLAPEMVPPDPVAEPSPGDSLSVADSAADQVPNLHEHVKKKRRLYRHVTEEQVMWFPHDNHPDLLRELIWESGNPRWVLHGTPASGAGILGCMEAGVSVIALCEDAHHETNLGVAMKERTVEAMLAGSRVFKDDDLQARALDLCPAMGKREKKDK